MFSNRVELPLFEFLMELIDIQIKKYVALAKRGVGPDARLNSTLVCDEVTELMNSADMLLNYGEKVQQQLVKTIADQLYFYLKCEGIRSLAGHLLDKNNIHNTVLIRVVEQKNQCRSLMRDLCLDWSEELDPQTEIQQACKYESCRIALTILQLAKDIEENPEKEWDIKLLPHHAQLALRKNAREGRYKEQGHKIETLFEKCTNYIENMDKPIHSFFPMNEKKVDDLATIHVNKFNLLLEQYKQINPQSPLFSQDHAWYQVGKLPQNSQVEKQTTSRNSCNFFAKTVVPLFLTGCLIAYLTQAMEDFNTPALGNS